VGGDTAIIKITALSGPHAGKDRVVPEGFDPMGLLTEFASKDWKWSVDFTQATQTELFEWGRADMVARILTALQHGRSVRFQDTEYRVERPEDLPHVAGEVEDAIAYSGLMVKVESDDSDGVTIGVGSTEHPMQ
jgi:hypothetical protein